MVVILVADNDSKIQKNLKSEFEKMDHSIELSNFDDAVLLYQENHPNITIINFDDGKKANKTIDDIMEFDNNACVLALSSADSKEKKDEILKSGVNAIIPVPLLYEEKDINEVMSNLIKVCSVFNNEKCMGCQLGNNH